MSDPSKIRISGVDLPEEELAPIELSPLNPSISSSMPNSLPEVEEPIRTKETNTGEEGYKTVTGTVVQTVQESKFLEALQSYFKIKNNYDNALQKKKDKIYKMKNSISLNNRRERIQKIKSNCILCKKPVGTIFSYRNKHYKAICGSTDQPCKLNIDLEAGNVLNIDNTLQLINEIYQDEIVEIMKTKLNLLFGFDTEDETITKFSELNESLKSNNKILKHYKDVKSNIINNSDKQEELERINNSISVLITDFKINMTKYRKEQKIGVLKDAMHLFHSNIKELLEKKKKLQYAYQEIEFNGLDNTFQLVQKKYLPNKLEDVIEPSKIITNQL